MSGLEAEKIRETMHSMTQEQLIVSAECIPDEILWGEVYSRFLHLREKTAIIGQALAQGGI